MKITAALVTLTTAAVSSVSAQFTNFVSTATNPIQYDGTNYTITPSPLCIGKQFCLTASGTLSTDIIEGSTYSIYGKSMGQIFYIEQKNDLCSILAANGTPCPVPAGAFNLNLCKSLLANFPRNWPWPMEFTFSARNGDSGTIFTQSTPGYVAYPLKPSDPPLKAIDCL